MDKRRPPLVYTVTVEWHPWREPKDFAYLTVSPEGGAGHCLFSVVCDRCGFELSGLIMSAAGTVMINHRTECKHPEMLNG